MKKNFLFCRANEKQKSQPYILKIHYSKFKLTPLTALLWMGELFYCAAVRTKNLLYELGILKEKRVNARVICVGNLTTGGVGKTPVVCEIVKYLKEKGEKVAVLSRGYGGKIKGLHIVESVESGDEPYLIAQATNVPVVVCADRVKGANYAIEKFATTTLVMDDGFSNRKIYKDLSIVLIDSKKQFGNSHLLPLGPLREPKSALKRANKVVVIDKEGLGGDCKMEPLELPPNVPLFAFCAIGQPEQFYNYLENVVGIKSYPDHYTYTQKDMDEISSLACASGAELIVTTEKDYVKIKDFAHKNIFVLKLKLSLNLEELLN